MSDHRGTSDERKRGESSDILTGDLQALKAESRQDMPTIQETARVFDSLPHAREGTLMTTVRRARPWWIPVTAAAAIAAGLLFVPISYQQTVGQTISMNLHGSLDKGMVLGIANTLGEATDAEDLKVSRGSDGVVIQAKVSGRSASEVKTMARAFVATLKEKGISAATEVTPWTETVSGNVYAFTANQLDEIRVPMAGRSEFEIEQDIRSQLENAGFLNPEVQVTRSGGRTEVNISAKGQDGGEIKIQEQREIQDISGDGSTLQEPELEIPLFGIDPNEFKGMSDAEIKAAIEQKMRERGITDLEVTVENGNIRCEARKEEIRHQ